MGPRQEERLLHITPWERSVLQSLSEGKSPAELALTLGMPERDIREQLSSLFSRMGAASPTDAVAVACRRGLIPAAPTPGASLL
jgi:NarL family two-component system response regulator YdfI